MNKTYKLVGLIPAFLLVVILLSVIPSVSSGSEVINTFLTYEDASAISKTVTQGDYVNLYLIAYGHGESLEYEKLELVSSTLIFKEYVSGDKILEYTWLYTKSPYVLNTGILTPGTYTLRFTASTKITHSVEYSELQLTILPKVVPPYCGDGTCNNGETCSSCPGDCGVCPPVCGNGKVEGIEQCDKGTLNGQVCNPLYGSSCTYCSNSCTWVTLKGPYCGDGTCSNGENCSTCPGDCGACADTKKPIVNITYPLAKDYCPHRTSMTFYVYDDNLHSCTYTLNGASPVNVPSLVNGFNTITGITSVVGSNTWSVTCRDVEGNTALDSVTFTVTCLPTCGDGVCNGYETCSSCPGDCGICPKDNCTICKDSKPLDDSDYDYYYLYQMNNKPTVISGEVTSEDLDLDETESYSLGSKLSFMIIIFIIGVLILLILIFIIRLSRR